MKRMIGTDISEEKAAERLSSSGRRYDKAIAELGQRALAGTPLPILFELAVNAVARVLEVEYTKLMEVLPDHSGLRLAAGVGWRQDWVGLTTLPASSDSQSGYTLRSAGPVVVEDLRTETRFEASALLLDHNLVSGMTVSIGSTEKPFGVLGAHSRSWRQFSADDVTFLQAVANVLGLAIARHRSQEGLQESRERYRSLVESSPDAILVSAQGKIAFANPAARALLGATADDQLIGKPALELVHGDYHDLVLRRSRETMEESKAAPFVEVSVVRLDGREVPVEAAVAPITMEGRGAALVVLRDLTERKQAEEKLRLQATALESAANAIVITDASGSIQWVNSAFERFTGYSHEEVLGRNPRILRSGQQDSQFYRDMWETIRAGKAWQGDVINRRKDGSLYSERMTITPVLNAKGEITNFVGIKEDITERKRTEQALRRQALTFENIYDAVIVTDRAYNITDWNPAATRMFGYEKTDALGRNVSSLHTPEEAERQLLSIKTGFESAGRWDGELAVVRKDGTRFMIRIVIVPLLNEWGIQIGTIGVSRDITERKQAEEALRHSEEKYRTLFERNPQPMWVYDDSSLRFLAVNQAAVDHYGYSRREFFSMTLKDIRPPEEAVRILSSVYGCTADIDRAGVQQHSTKDGRIIVVEITDSRIEFEGRPASLMLLNDVTEQERAERELQISEEKYRELFENAGYGMFRSTVDGTLLDVNPAFVAMLGYDSKEELLALNLQKDVYENGGEREAIMDAYQANPKRVIAEANLQRKGGGVIKVKLSGRTVRNRDGQVAQFEVIAEDVTQQRRLEEQFRQAQKMEAVGRLAGGIAHDFNNVLMIVNSYAELIMGRQSMDPAIQSYTEHIIQAGKKATSLTNQMLAFSRTQLLQPTVLDLQAVVTDLSKMLPPMLGEDIDMTIVAEPGLGNIHADRAQIEQVLMNLVVNARDAMPNGGKLQIELRNAIVDSEYIQRHPQIPTGSYVVLAVSDTGVGMDAATQARIFEPFFTTKGVGKGTGLGLSTVYGIVKQSGGFVWVYSEPGLGTTFTIYLPRVYGETVAASHAAEEKQAYRHGCETVLLVDDNPDVRSATREFLEGDGFQVLEAENGAGALGVCTAHQGEIQVLVTDLIMPGMRGTELAAKVSKLYPQVKIVYMSGYTNRSQDIEDLGPDAVFLQKPFSLNILAQKVHTALQRKKGDGQSD